MSLHVRKSGVWEDVIAPSVNVGGTWEDGEDTSGGTFEAYAYIGALADWRMVWPLEVAVDDVQATATVSNIFSSTITCRFKLYSDGTLGGHLTGLSPTQFTENPGNADRTQTTPVMFEYKWTTISGTVASSPASAGVWRDLDISATEKEWTEYQSGIGSNSSAIRVYIRAKNAPTSEIDFQVDLTAEVTV